MNLQEKLYLQVQAAERLVANWRAVARDQDAALIRANCDLDHDEAILSLRTASVLRGCAKELEEATREDIVSAWSKRHGLDLCSSDLRCAFDDAATAFSDTVPRSALIALIDKWQKQVDYFLTIQQTPLRRCVIATLKECAKELEEALK